MRSTKYLVATLFIVSLVFAGGCGAGGGIAGAGQPTDKTTSQAVSPATSLVASTTTSFDMSKYPPSDWPEKPIVTHSESDGKITFEEGTYSDRYWTSVGLDYLNAMGDKNAGEPTKEKPAIPDYKTAAAVATALFHASDMYKDPNGVLQIKVKG